MRPYVRDPALLGSLGWGQLRSGAVDRSTPWTDCHSRQRSEHPPILEVQPPLEVADEPDQRSRNRFVDRPCHDGFSRRLRVIGGVIVIRGRQSNCDCGIVHSGDLGATSTQQHRGRARAHCLC